MSSVLHFIKRHLWTLLLLVVCVVVAEWIIRTQRAPGSMTIIEAQAMDMTNSKAPLGTQPVSAEAATKREIGGSESFPATLSALSDEEVMARVPGRISKVLVYNGDRVRPGQLLATIDASEYGAQAGEASYMASSKLAMATAMMREISMSKAMIRKAEAMVKASNSGLKKMQVELDSAKSEREKAEAELTMSQAEVRDREADAKYATQSLEREKKLYKAGAISLDELQMATKEQDGAQARLRAAKAAVQAKERDVDIAKQRVDGAKAGVKEANAMVSSAKAEHEQSQAALAKAKQNAKATKLEAKASQSAASGMAAMAGYRNVRASSNGVVSERVASPGSVVMMGQVILRIKDTSKLRVQADLPQRLYSQLKVGTEVSIDADSVSVDATVTSVSPSIDPETRTFRVEALVDNEENELAPGMFAKLKVKTSESKEQLAVKARAVQTEANGDHYVWIIKENANADKETDWTCSMHPEISEQHEGFCPKCKMALIPRNRSGKFTAEKVTVQIGESDGSYTAISSGLKEGDKVIWSGIESLQPGLPVQDSATSNEVKTEQPTASDHPTHAYKYICPMKCKGSESDKPGTCPVCKMDLVTVESLEGKK